MAPSSPVLQQLAQRLRELRENQWSERLTQAALAEAFGDVAAATVSSWENTAAPKLPPPERLKAYAQFFATHRSIEGETPALLSVDTFSEEEQAARKELEDELLALREEATRKPAHQADVTARRSWRFPDTGPLTIVCAQLPADQTSVFADPADPNYMELQSFADLDALVELFGHVRAENPHMEVHYRAADKVVADDLSGHLVLLGGIAWNEVTQRLSEMMPVLPVDQIQDDAVPTGEIFTVDDGKRKFLPKWRDDAHKILTEDVGLLVRAPNPLNSSRALFICNGIHSRGVLGAVRSLTDVRLRESNERYIAENFADSDSYAILMRVPVIEAEALTPNFNNAGFVLYQWP
jgi:transcriptional regulator with XRE-family HTH domain